MLISRDGVEEKLTSFESQAGLDKGSYGFRIWRGSKTITLENIKRTEIVTSSLERSTEVLSKDAWGKTDVSIPVQFGSEDEISSIMNGDETLNPGTDYTVEDSVFTLKQEYIAAVSYTHLDVYKRQAKKLFNLKWLIKQPENRCTLKTAYRKQIFYLKKFRKDIRGSYRQR